jgi:hypothetical protein
MAIGKKAEASKSEKRKEKKRTEAKTSAGQAVCSTCRSEEVSTRPKSPDSPGLFSDEPAPCESRQEARTAYHAPSRTRKGVVYNSETKSDKSRGLCSSCAIRKNCRFPKPAGGVWHCEEYE